MQFIATDSCPPCMVPVLWKTPAVLPTSFPLCQSPPVESMRVFIWAGIPPNRAETPNMIPSKSPSSFTFAESIPYILRFWRCMHFPVFQRRGLGTSQVFYFHWRIRSSFNGSWKLVYMSVKGVFKNGNICHRSFKLSLWVLFIQSSRCGLDF